MDLGKSKMFLKQFDFLIKDFGFNFSFQIFDQYKYFYGPVYAYSFYNDKVCFTFHNIAQRGEWGIYYTKRFVMNNQHALLEEEVHQKNYSQKNHFLTYFFIKDFANIIKNEIVNNNTIFGKKIE